ncbi:MAG: hypothetical protein AAFY47_06300 [Pseudomonadota bacterium]
MSDQDEEIHIDDDDARAGESPGVVRRVLAFGLILAIVAMSAVWISAALWG